MKGRFTVQGGCSQEGLSSGRVLPLWVRFRRLLTRRVKLKEGAQRKG